MRIALALRGIMLRRQDDDTNAEEEKEDPVAGGGPAAGGGGPAAGGGPMPMPLPPVAKKGKWPKNSLADPKVPARQISPGSIFDFSGDAHLDMDHTNIVSTLRGEVKTRASASGLPTTTKTTTTTTTSTKTTVMCPAED